MLLPVSISYILLLGIANDFKQPVSFMLTNYINVDIWLTQVNILRWGDLDMKMMVIVDLIVYMGAFKTTFL